MPIDHFHAIIPAGGSGTRLWPLSRSSHPKFLLDLDGSGRTLVQHTWDRLAPLTGDNHVHVVSGPAHAQKIREQLPALQHSVVEPSPRDSMPAIALAAAIIERLDPDAVVGSFAADHMINDVEGFTDAVRTAVATAEAGLIVTIGITPTHPSTAFGYVEGAGRLDTGALAVRRFVEKPTAHVAQIYLDSQDFFWNAGMFVTRADVLLGHLERLHPTMAAGVRTIAAAWDGPDREAVLAATWPTLTKIAIDHAIAEPVSLEGGMAVVPATFDWSDVGDFAALAELVGTDREDVLWVDAGGLVVGTPATQLVVVGIEDAVVVHTPDAILVTTTAHSQSVKKVPDALRERGRPDLT